MKMSFTIQNIAAALVALMAALWVVDTFPII